MLLAALVIGCHRGAPPTESPPPPPEAMAPAADATPPTEDVTDNPIAQALASGKPSFVSFGADKCIPCRTMAPIREAVAQKYAGRVNVVYIRVDQHPALAEQYRVQYIPHLIFFDPQGQESFTHTGTMTQDDIEAQLARLGAEG